MLIFVLILVVVVIVVALVAATMLNTNERPEAAPPPPPPPPPFDPVEQCELNNNFGNVASQHCNTFHICLPGSAPILLHCAEGLAFDETSRQCQDAATVNCNGRPFV
ncbi:hypothetical protein QKQ66_gp054 [Dione juno nucleopolyhedrovirus]|uniref:Chitin-binding type-2 domain-containing protein n=1 Tax=Dione juno nucleopolyhedrovirus TaxID=2594175 RepID=A0AAE6H2V8_9ABAC|nr:hypothetical protein QKQ66_gp054 [Dione juno nucleopolyhedrovirus]QDL57031.1 hypothetical protein DijuNPV-ORF-54 [Dione juno nucleopolyhedrovirus]